MPKDDGNKSWVGKPVLPKTDASSAQFPVADESNIKPKDDGIPFGLSVTLDGASYAVKGERERELKALHSNGIACWIEKDQLVLLADAIEFFGKALKSQREGRSPIGSPRAAGLTTPSASPTRPSPISMRS